VDAGIGSSRCFSAGPLHLSVCGAMCSIAYLLVVRGLVCIDMTTSMVCMSCVRCGWYEQQLSKGTSYAVKHHLHLAWLAACAVLKCHYECALK
jgi:hypothetical protein